MDQHRAEVSRRPCLYCIVSSVITIILRWRGSYIQGTTRSLRLRRVCSSLLLAAITQFTETCRRAETTSLRACRYFFMHVTGKILHLDIRFRCVDSIIEEKLPCDPAVSWSLYRTQCTQHGPLSAGWQSTPASVFYHHQKQRSRIQSWTCSHTTGT